MKKLLLILLLLPALTFAQPSSTNVFDVKLVDANGVVTTCYGSMYAVPKFKDTQVYDIKLNDRSVGRIQIIESYNLYLIIVTGKWTKKGGGEVEKNDQYVIGKESFVEYGKKINGQNVEIFENDDLQLILIGDKFYIAKAALPTPDDGRCFYFIPNYGNLIPKWTL